MTEVLDRPKMSNANGGEITRHATALGNMAARYQISQEGLADVIRKTCIQGECSDAQFKAFVLVANQYGLNPMTREIHAFTDPRRGVVPIVGIDGWARIVNSQPAFDGCDFEEKNTEDDLAVTCTMHVKGRSHPIRVTEWLSECKRNTPPWNTMKRRMLRHKAFMQAARLAFSIGGVYDEDEARDIITRTEAPAPTLKERMKVTARPVSEGQTLVDMETGEDLTPQAEAPEPQVDDNPEPPPADTIDEREAFQIQVMDALQAAGIPFDQKAKNALKKFAVAAAVVGKEHEATAEQKSALWEAIAQKRGDWAYAAG